FSGCHVIWNNIGNQSEAMLPERCNQPPQAILTAEFFADPAMIDHVISVRRAAPRGKYRRGIDMADTKPRKIGNSGGRIVEGKIIPELKTIGGARCHSTALGEMKASIRVRSLSSRRKSRVLRRRRQFGCSSMVPGMFG